MRYEQGQLLRFVYNSKLRVVRVERVRKLCICGFDNIYQVYRTFSKCKMENVCNLKKGVSSGSSSNK